MAGTRPGYPDRCASPPSKVCREVGLSRAEVQDGDVGRSVEANWKLYATDATRHEELEAVEIVKAKGPTFSSTARDDQWRRPRQGDVAAVGMATEEKRRAAIGQGIDPVRRMASNDFEHRFAGS